MTGPLSHVQVRPHCSRVGRSDVDDSTSRELLLGPMALVSYPLGLAGINLQEGKVGIGVPYVTHPTLKLVSQGQSEPSSLSSSILTRSDAKAIKAVEIMKSCHDFNSTLSVESLVLIRKLYSILDKYALSASLLGQRSYHEYPRGFASRLKP
ncbi:hypothetical protein B296_00029362 [Ensete ventricosum]|uniref:Uncharacterized protein n=1 Tax=Ensete ventricosum TaxID=4639 RepID=A0A427AL95_ENSVE|nr:hypothetical protein B296_00029362 [Ensete ventricosum]